MDNSKDIRMIGILYAFSGIILMSFDSLLIRLAGVSGGTTAFYRGFFIFITIGIIFLRNNRKNCLKILKEGGFPLLLSGILWGLSSFFFVQGVKLTSAANVLILLSVSPVIAAILSFFILREIIMKRIWVSILLSITGVVIIFSGDIKAGTLSGNIFGLLVPFCLALNLTVMRKYSQVSKTAAITIGGFVSAVISLPFAAPLTVNSVSLLYLGLLGFAVMPFSQLLISMGTKYISSAEVGLIMISETFLGPLWIWIVLSELPGRNTFLGGSLILSAIVFNSLLTIRESRVKIKGNRF